MAHVPPALELGIRMKANFFGFLGDAVPGRVAEFLLRMSDPTAQPESELAPYSVLLAVPVFAGFMCGCHLLNGGRF